MGLPAVVLVAIMFAAEIPPSNAVSNIGEWLALFHVPIPDAIKGKNADTWIFWIALVFLIIYIIAGILYCVWHKKLKSPKLGGKLIAINPGTWADREPAIIVEGEITNPHGPPSGLIGWVMSIELPDGRKYKGLTRPLPKELESRGFDQELILPLGSYWPLTADQPIPAGGCLRGWFFSVFPDANVSELFITKAIVTVEFRDVITNNKHKLTKCVQ